jgi:putative DNA-invertase from lambdoid prophage Rac
VLVWSLDRFSREGIAQTFLHINKLEFYGVKFESYTEPHFRTTGPAGTLLIAVAAWVAEQERVRIAERVKAGLERVRRNGTKTGNAIGRLRRIFRRDEAIQLHQSGWSFRRIAVKYGVSEATVRKTYREMRENPPAISGPSPA